MYLFKIYQTKLRKILIFLKNSLVFNLGPDKRYLKLSETQLAIQLDLPANYWLDNDAVSKLFENLEMTINYETISHKRSSVDYLMTNNFFNIVSYDSSYIMSTMDCNGFFDPL